VTILSSTTDGQPTAKPLSGYAFTPLELRSLHAPSFLGRLRYRWWLHAWLPRLRTRAPVPASLHKVYHCQPRLQDSCLQLQALVRSQCPMYVAIPGLAWYGYGTCVRRAPIPGRTYASTLLSRWHVHPRTNRLGVSTLAMPPPYVLHKHTPVCARAISERLPLYRPTA
jgi:hypothetical protein